jgi:hypothetical protein
MARILVVVFISFSMAIAAISAAPKDPPEKLFRVTCVVSYNDGEKKVQWTMDPKTGANFTLEGLSKSDPSYNKMRPVPVPMQLVSTGGVQKAKAETIHLGPEAHFCVRPAEGNSCVLDVTLSETVAEKNDEATGVLQVLTLEKRSIQSVQIDERITFDWPATVAGDPQRQVSFRVATR